jgi:hypothetical protein
MDVFFQKVCGMRRAATGVRLFGPFARPRNEQRAFRNLENVNLFPKKI